MAQHRPDRVCGPGHDEFWAGCDAGELRLQRCAICGSRPWPVVAACEICGSADLRFEALSGFGTVIGWCCFERDYYSGLLPIPWTTLLVELEEGPLFISNPRGFSWSDTIVGMPVRVAFEPCVDAAGFFSLPVFERR